MPWRSPSRQRSDRRAGTCRPTGEVRLAGGSTTICGGPGLPRATWYAGWTAVSFLALARIHARGHLRSLATGSFYGDSFVKAFLVVVRAAMSVRMPVSRGRSIWQIRAWGMRKVRASARTSFYPWRTQASDTTCNIRAECAGKPLLSARPIFGDGHVVVTRCRFGRVDLRSCC